jgi:hypothetical protein
MAYWDWIINIGWHNFIRIRIFLFFIFSWKFNTTFVFVFVKANPDICHIHFQVVRILILPRPFSISWIRMSDNMDYPLPVSTPMSSPQTLKPCVHTSSTCPTPSLKNRALPTSWYFVCSTCHHAHPVPRTKSLGESI